MSKINNFNLKIKFKNLCLIIKSLLCLVLLKLKKLKLYGKGICYLILPYLIIMTLLIVVPLLIIILYSVIQPTGNSLVFEFNFFNFIKFFSEVSFFISLLLSLAYALSAALLSIVIAYPVAYVMAFCKSKLFGKNIWILVTLPIWINMLLRTIGLRTIFYLVAPNLLGTPISIIIGMVYIFIPFVILPIYNSLDKIDRSLVEVSRDLGASAFKTFWRIIFRFSIPGIFIGGIMLLVQATTSLIIIKFMGNGQVFTIVEIVEAYFFRGGNFGFGAAISIILAVIFIFIFIISDLISKKFEYGKKERMPNYEKFS